MKTRYLCAAACFCFTSALIAGQALAIDSKPIANQAGKMVKTDSIAVKTDSIAKKKPGTTNPKAISGEPVPVRDAKSGDKKIPGQNPKGLEPLSFQPKAISGEPVPAPQAGNPSLPGEPWRQK